MKAFDRVLDRTLVSSLQAVITQEDDSVTSSSSDVCAFPKRLGSLILKFYMLRELVNCCTS